MHSKDIRISRHARRRISLYELPEKDIVAYISGIRENGRHEIVKRMKGFKYPIKIIFEINDTQILLITAFPLKRGLK